MDEDYAKGVRKVFCDWYHDGLIYKGRRIVNWCPSCTTAIADDEAEYVDEKATCGTCATRFPSQSTEWNM